MSVMCLLDQIRLCIDRVKQKLKLVIFLLVRGNQIIDLKVVNLEDLIFLVLDAPWSLVTGQVTETRCLSKRNELGKP